ncbi:MAG: GNAT family N-acetyltransferase [Desertimonas sp.]
MDVIAASALFDSPANEAWAQLFLEQPNHHLCIAYRDGRAAGFVSGIEMTHPDKGTEMFLYELGVDESHRGHGIGTALVRALVERARTAGCYGVWTLSERDNTAHSRRIAPRIRLKSPTKSCSVGACPEARQTTGVASTPG